jgi:linoleate 10R-lipoxygenase
MAEVLRVVFGLKNLRRAPGYSGQLNTFVETVDGIDQRRFIDYNGRVKQQPSSLILQYEL